MCRKFREKQKPEKRKQVISRISNRKTAALRRAEFVYQVSGGVIDMVNRTIYRSPSGKNGARTNNTAGTDAPQETPAAPRVNTPGRPAGKPSAPVNGNIPAYGGAFQSGPLKLAVRTPGETAAISLSDSMPLAGGITHEAGSAELVVSAAGDYYIEMALCVTSDSAKQAVFALQVNGCNIQGGIWDMPLRSGFQSITGFALARLNEGSRIRIVMTALSPLEVTLAGSGTTAALSVIKL